MFAGKALLCIIWNYFYLIIPGNKNQLTIINLEVAAAGKVNQCCFHIKVCNFKSNFKFLWDKKFFCEALQK